MNRIPNQTGSLKVQCFIENSFMPIENAKIIITKSNRQFEDIEELKTVYTNESGYVDNIILDTPDISLSYKPLTLPYGIYNIQIIKKDYKNLIIKGVQVFPERIAIQTCYLKQGVASNSNTEIIIISEHKQVTNSDSKKPDEIKPTDKFYYSDSIIQKQMKSMKRKRRHMRVLSKIIVPSYIIVHAGSPYNSSAPNYKIPFVDYIKNVACSELYATWNSSALIANIYCIVSFALNRIFTEWYPSHGGNFDITNDTAYDQSFIYGRTTYNSIDILVDKLFSSFIEEQNENYPLFAQYCNGTSVTCPGWLSQWGSQYLATHSYFPYEILTYYYGANINLKIAPEIEGDPRSYPGAPLTIGSKGANVLKKQTELNAISNNYPLIPKLELDGIYGSKTSNSVKVYQGIFNIPTTGIIDFATWYSLSRVYTAVEQFNELK